VHQISAIEDRLRHSTTMPDSLAASFDTFETIRLIARQHELAAPQLFAAFMTTAAAAEGRDAITAAPSLPLAGRPPAAIRRARTRARGRPGEHRRCPRRARRHPGQPPGPRRGPASRRRRPGRVPGRGPVSPPDPPADRPRR
jgi:hypothetical protein